MSALRDNADLLLNVLNVFIMEPLLDWNKPAIGIECIALQRMVPFSSPRHASLNRLHLSHNIDLHALLHSCPPRA